MKNITLTKDFFLGGKATFTVQNNDTGVHRTYKIRKPTPTPQYPNPAWFVKVMTGTDNESHYSYVGRLFPNGGQIYRNGQPVQVLPGHIEMTKNSKFDEASDTVKAARWVTGRIMTGASIPDQIEIRHAGKCGRCGRTLTAPESLDTGIGPECAKILGCSHQ